MKEKELAPGTRVEITRINGEKAEGVIGEGPLGYLGHIGPFYQVRAPGEGRRKGPMLGTYDGKDIRVRG